MLRADKGRLQRYPEFHSEEVAPRCCRVTKAAAVQLPPRTGLLVAAAVAAAAAAVEGKSAAAMTPSASDALASLGYCGFLLFCRLENLRSKRHEP